MLDEETFDRFMETVAMAQRNGLALPETLDEHHLLLTPRQRQDITMEALGNLVRRLDRQTPNKLMSFFYGRTEGTATEMFNAMKMWVDTVVRNQANGTLEDL